jgi:hypothetical protein
MKAGDIIPQKEKIGKVISHIAKNIDKDGKSVFTGSELKEKYDYNFIHSGLIVTIDKNIEPAADREYKVDEFWGNEIRIDIAAKGLSNSEIRKILVKAFDEYMDVINRKSQKYDQL